MRGKKLRINLRSREGQLAHETTQVLQKVIGYRTSQSIVVINLAKLAEAVIQVVQISAKLRVTATPNSSVD